MRGMSGGVFEQIAKGGFYIPSAGDAGLSGTVIGEFELVRLLSNGATSDVWEGVNRTTRESVAVKIACRRDDAGLKARFEHEAQLLGTVLSAEGEDCPYPRYYGHGDFEGRPYLVTEQLEDITVPDESDQFGKFLLEVLDAVETLHRCGYIHQDLKPANMMRRRSNGRLVLIDFGQAHRIEEGRLTPQRNTLTMDASGRRTATGTAGYCAPEQLDAERTAFLPATDVYALGMLIRNFCGRMSEWRQVGSDATDPDLRRRIPDVMTLRRQVRNRSWKNRQNATRDLLQDIEFRRSRPQGDVHMSWEKLVSIILSNRRRTSFILSNRRRTSFHSESSTMEILTQEVASGRLPGLGLGVREFGAVRIFVPWLFRYVVDERLHFTHSAVICVCGSGTFELDVSADQGVAFVISGDCTVINRSSQQTGIDYFVNNGALLCFPQIAESESEELQRHVHLASFDGAFVRYGSGTTRVEINQRYRREWEEKLASGDSDAFALLRESRFARPDDGVPIVLRR